MKNFRDLRVWQEAHQLTLAIYRLTKRLPREEQFGLCSQMRRAAVSIEANLAEGCGRGTDGELHRFAQISFGSASELECHLLICLDLEMMEQAEYADLEARLQNVRRMLSGLSQKLAASKSAAV